MTPEELNTYIGRIYDNQTTFAKIYNAFNELLDIATAADNEEILTYYQQCDLIKIRELAELLNENYDKYYNALD